MVILRLGSLGAEVVTAGSPLRCATPAPFQTGTDRMTETPPKHDRDTGTPPPRAQAGGRGSAPGCIKSVQPQAIANWGKGTLKESSDVEKSMEVLLFRAALSQGRLGPVEAGGFSYNLVI